MQTSVKNGKMPGHVCARAELGTPGARVLQYLQCSVIVFRMPSLYFFELADSHTLPYMASHGLRDKSVNGLLFAPIGL